MLKAGLSIISILFFLTACNDTEKQGQSRQFLPSSMGGFDQLIVVADCKKMDAAVSDSLKKYLNVSYEILFRPEPMMDVSFIEVNNFRNFVTRTRNVLFIGVKSVNDPTFQYLNSTLGSEVSQKLLSRPSKPYEFKQDIWARNQMVGFAFANDYDDLFEVLRNHSKDWIQTFMDSDLPEYREFTFMSGVNESLKKQLGEYYNFQLDVPTDFILAKNENGFIWLRRDDPEMTLNLMIDVQEYDAEKQPFANRGLLKRNKLGVAHVSSDLPGSYMSTDSTLGFIQKYSIVDNHPRFENRGLWRMENDFKGGPFLNYYIHDTKHNQIIFIEGFAYGPTKDKKPVMRQIETILSTFRVI